MASLEQHLSITHHYEAWTLFLGQDKQRAQHITVSRKTSLGGLWMWRVSGSLPHLALLEGGLYIVV